MRHRLLVHIVWTTKDRAPMINREAADYLRNALPMVALQERANVLEIWIVSTHLHLLVALHPNTVIPHSCSE